MQYPASCTVNFMRERGEPPDATARSASGRGWAMTHEPR